MRHRFAELFQPDALVNGAQYMHTGNGQTVAPVMREIVQRVRANAIPNDPDRAHRLDVERGFNSRNTGA